MRMGADQQFCLRWNNFHTNITSAFESLRDDEDFVDITLACEGRQVKAHKMVLSACSPYFRNLLKGNPCQHPIVFLKDVTFANLASILDFMYHGEVNVSHNELATFLKTAEALKVRGLAEDDKKKDSDGYNEASSPSPPKDPPDPAASPRPDESNATDTNLSDSTPPPPKRQRCRSIGSVQSTEDTSETLISDIRETSVKNEPQDFNDSDILGHSSGIESNNVKSDNMVNSEETSERNNFGISDSVTISRSQAAMQQLQDSFGPFLPSMSQAPSYISHGANELQRPPYSMDNVPGLPPGISNLPGPSMSQAGASQDNAQGDDSGSEKTSKWTSFNPKHQSLLHHFTGDVEHDRYYREISAFSNNSPASERNGFSEYNFEQDVLADVPFHIASRMMTVKHECPHCNKTLSSSHGLRRHISDKHTIHLGSYRCVICHKDYRTPNSLQNHTSVYHKKKNNLNIIST